MDYDNIIDIENLNTVLYSSNKFLNIFRKIILMINNFLLKLIYYIVLPYSFNLIRYPFLNVSYPLKFRSLHNRSIYSFLINSFEFTDNDIIIEPNNLDPNLSNAIIIQNHVSPIRDILTTMYINDKCFYTPLSFVGTVFSSFESYYLKKFSNKMIDSLTKEVSMIMLEWDETKNKPVTGQIPKLISEVGKLLDNKWNVAIYPQGQPNCDQNKFKQFKSGLSHLIKDSQVDKIILISTIYLDHDDVLLDQDQVKNLNWSKIRIIVEQVDLDRNLITSDSSIVSSINNYLQNKMNINLGKLKKKFVKKSIKTI